MSLQAYLPSISISCLPCQSLEILTGFLEKLWFVSLQYIVIVPLEEATTIRMIKQLFHKTPFISTLISHNESLPRALGGWVIHCVLLIGVVDRSNLSIFMAPEDNVGLRRCILALVLYLITWCLVHWLSSENWLRQIFVYHCLLIWNSDRDWLISQGWFS